jgi:RND family efflux transporter MFP subunit
MKTFYSILTAAVVVATLASCSHEAKSDKTDGLKVPAATDVISVKVQTIGKQVNASTVIASGLFTTDDASSLGFKIGGVVEKVYVDQGQAVQKGQLLATLNVTEIEAGLRQAQLGLEKAERDLKRATNLYKDSVVTLEQLQNAQTGVDVARKQLESVQFNRQFSEIRATRNGFVLQKFAFGGEVVGPGTPIVKVNGAKSDDWKLRVAVSDRDWAAIQLGDRAVVDTDVPALTQLGAKVTRKAEIAEAANGAFSVELTLDKKPAGLVNGMFGKAVIQAQSGNGLLRIPYSALLDGDKGTGYIYVTKDGKTVHRQQVNVARIERDDALISGGLNCGDRIIVSGSPYLAEGTLIKIQ